jgi:hypothetical protein
MYGGRSLQHRGCPSSDFRAGRLGTGGDSPPDTIIHPQWYFEDTQFNETIKNVVGTEVRQVLEDFSSATVELCTKASEQVVWNPPTDDVRRLFNHHVDLVWASSISKLSLLAKGIIRSVNDQNFLMYGLAGRSLIEHIAVLRYYLVEVAHPILERATQRGTTDVEDLKKLIHILDTLHRGSRFDWESFLTGDIHSLMKREPSDRPRQVQVRVGQCIKSWKREDPSVGVLYALFSDLVHPNIGANLLVMKRWDEGIGFGGSGGRFFGIVIFEQSLPRLAALMTRARDLLNGLLLMRLPDISD